MEELINSIYQPIRLLGLLGVTFTVPSKINLVPEGIFSLGDQESLCND